MNIIFKLSKVIVIVLRESEFFFTKLILFNYEYICIFVMIYLYTIKII